MSTNSLAIFKQLFLKNPKDIKDIFTHVTTFVEDKDKVIAEFLAVEYPELIWLIHILQVEYEKQFFSNPPSPHVVEKIARSITLTVDETGILDYGQKDHNNVVLNTLETHLVSSQYDMLHQDHDQEEDVISLDGSNTNMDVVYQKNTTFHDIVSQLNPPTTSMDTKEVNNIQTSRTLSTSTSPQQTKPLNTSNSTDPKNSLQDVTVTPAQNHMINQNANDAVDVAQVVDQIVTSLGKPMNLSNSIHAPKRQSIVNLPPKDPTSSP